MPTPGRLATLAATAAVCLGTSTVPALAADGGTVVSRGVTIPAFYNPPATLPIANGALVRSEPLPLALSLPGIDGPLPGRATRVMYKSTDSNGLPVAVTDAYIEPAAAWHGTGPRPLVALGPGTMGQGDQCAASLGLEHPLRFNGQTVSVGYENLAIYRLLAKGIAVVVTDYAGLGATDRHVRQPGGRGPRRPRRGARRPRAARNLPHRRLTRSLVRLQPGRRRHRGGRRTPVRLRPRRTPLRHLLGGAARDLTEVTKAIDGSDLAGALGWSVNGFLQSDPALRPIADAHLNSAGRAALDDLSTMCVGDALFTYNSARSTAWTTDGETISDVIAAEPALHAFLDEQRIGTMRPSGPVRLATGTSDDLVPHAQARRLAVDWCRLGGNVTYKPVVLPDAGRSLINHFAPLLTDQGDAIAWLTDRLNGKPVASARGLLPMQP